MKITHRQYEGLKVFEGQGNWVSGTQLIEFMSLNLIGWNGDEITLTSEGNDSLREYERGHYRG